MSGGTNPGNAFTLGRRPALDGVRAVAVISVIAYHLYIHLGGHFLARGGFLGVDIFFVLSGFLITSLLLEEHRERGRLDLRAFYTRRFLRLGPALFTMLAVLAAWAVVHDLVVGGHVTRRIAASLPYAALYVANWAEALQIRQLLDVNLTWTLSVEEQFYLMWPAVLVAAFAAAWSIRRIGWLAAIGAACSFVIAVALVSSGANYARLYYGTDVRAASILIGCCLAVIAYNGALSARVARLLVIPAAATVVLMLQLAPVPGHGDRILYDGGLIVFELATAAVLAALVTGQAGWLGSVLSTRPAVWLGRLSYSLYLWTSVVLWEVGQRYHYTLVSNAAALTLAVLLATGSYYLVELPFLRRKRRYARVTATAPADTAREVSESPAGLALTSS